MERKKKRDAPVRGPRAPKKGGGAGRLACRFFNTQSRGGFGGAQSRWRAPRPGRPPWGRPPSPRPRAGGRCPFGRAPPRRGPVRRGRPPRRGGRAREPAAPTRGREQHGMGAVWGEREVGREGAPRPTSARAWAGAVETTLLARTVRGPSGVSYDATKPPPPPPARSSLRSFQPSRTLLSPAGACPGGAPSCRGEEGGGHVGKPYEQNNSCVFFLLLVHLSIFFAGAAVFF